MTPFFSIIIPVYNVAPYVRECLDSVFAQTFVDWEAICVDDGSTDGSSVIIDEYAAKDSRIRLFRQENHGVGAARNVGLDHASGKYVIFVDADDVLSKNWLISFRNAIGSEGYDVVRASLTFWNGADDYDSNGTDQKGGSIIKRYDGTERVLCWGVNEVLTNGYSVINCIRSEVVKDIRFPGNVRILEDCIFSALVMARASSAIIIASSGYRYRMREDSAIHRRTMSENIASDLNELFVSVQDLWNDISSRIHDTDLLCKIRMFITRFVRRNLIDLGVGNRKRLRNPNKDFSQLAATIRELISCGAIDISSFDFVERFVMWLYLKFALWRGMILLRLRKYPARRLVKVQ